MTDMILTRRIFTNKSTIGKLVIDDLEVFTLEDTCRNRDLNNDNLLQKEEKIYGETAIPAGSYDIEIRQSMRYGRPMPYLLDVPFYDAIMIHWGNTAVNTFGCILVGRTHPSVDFIGESRLAFDALFPKIEEALKEGPLKLRIAGGYSADEFRKKGA